MIKITAISDGGFEITIDRRKWRSIKVKTGIDGLHHIIDHYYGNKHQANEENCPLCGLANKAHQKAIRKFSQPPWEKPNQFERKENEDE